MFKSTRTKRFGQVKTTNPQQTQRELGNPVIRCIPELKTNEGTLEGSGVKIEKPYQEPVLDEELVRQKPDRGKVK